MSVKIIPVRFTDNGFMNRPFALGGDPAEHDGVPFEDLPADWRCPRCKQPKEKFNCA